MICHSPSPFKGVKEVAVEFFPLHYLKINTEALEMGSPLSGEELFRLNSITSSNHCLIHDLSQRGQWSQRRIILCSVELTEYWDIKSTDLWWCLLPLVKCWERCWILSDFENTFNMCVFPCPNVDDVALHPLQAWINNYFFRTTVPWTSWASWMPYTSASFFCELFLLSCLLNI